MRMKVVKVLNNSLVLALDQEGREHILMGKGIGYRKSIGMLVKTEDVEKIFVLKDIEFELGKTGSDDFHSPDHSKS